MNELNLEMEYQIAKHARDARLSQQNKKNKMAAVRQGKQKIGTNNGNEINNIGLLNAEIQRLKSENVKLRRYNARLQPKCHSMGSDKPKDNDLCLKEAIQCIQDKITKLCVLFWCFCVSSEFNMYMI